MSGRAQAVRLTWDGKPSFGAERLAGARADDRAQHRSTHGELHAGDNAAVLRGLLPRLKESFTLAYLDPPFFTGKIHEYKRRGAGAEPQREAAFDDRWRSRAAYLDALGERLVLVRELLTADGSVVVHVDPKVSHYVRVLCDEIFGEDAFASEIIWRYRRWPAKTPNFQRVHDVLLRYRKDPREKPRWQQQYEPLAASTRAVWGEQKQRAVRGDDGRRLRSSREQQASPGVPLGDVWDISVLAPIAKERTGYPSQKPEALLERLIVGLSLPGDRVLDPYAGSGTTLAVAQRCGRWFCGIDQSPVALEVAAARLGFLDIKASADTNAARDAADVACVGPKRAHGSLASRAKTA